MLRHSGTPTHCHPPPPKRAKPGITIGLDGAQLINGFPAMSRLMGGRGWRQMNVARVV